MAGRCAFRVALAALAASLALVAGAEPITVRGIHPAIPKPFEMVHIRLSGCLDHAREGNFIQVVQGSGSIIVAAMTGFHVDCPSAPPANQSDFEVRLGAFPAGTYTVDVGNDYDVLPVLIGVPPPSMVRRQRLTFQVVAPPQVQVFPQAPVPYADFSGMWWNPAESGWGLSIAQSATNQMFVAFYAYDASGNPEWFVVPGGTWSSPVRWSGTLYRTSGPPLGVLFGGTFNPQAVVRTPVGTASLDFVPHLHALDNPAFGEARFEYQIDGVTGSRLIRRMEY